jgi:hypothetical protein
MDTQLLFLIITTEARRFAHRLRTEGDRGDAAEKVITIAAMTALAILVMGVIATKVSSKADSINF